MIALRTYYDLSLKDIEKSKTGWTVKCCETKLVKDQDR